MGLKIWSLFFFVVRIHSFATDRVFRPSRLHSDDITVTTSPTTLFSSSNSFSSMFGGMASSLFGDAKAIGRSSVVEKGLQSLDIPSWSEIRSRLEEVQTPEERKFRDNLPFGYGEASPLHNLRLYSESNKEEDVRVTFYRDSASWCPYCQKVWLTLEQKQIPYRVKRINMRCYGDKPFDFLRIQPGGQIPVAEIDGKIYGQSNDILMALEERFPDQYKMLPGPKDMPKAQQYFRLERQLFSAWMYWLTTARGPSAKTEFVEVLNTVEQVLKEANGPFFMGQGISMVDVQFSSFLERMAASLLYFKGFKIREPKGVAATYPNINAWFDAMETLPAYQLTKSDYYTHSWDLPVQLGGCVAEPDGEPYRKAINGERSLDGSQGSWEFPLQPHNGGVEPDWDWAIKDATSPQREAVERLSANSEAIVRFAARGAGRKGMPSFDAPLSDPNAVPNDAVQPAVDSVLRVVSVAILEGSSDCESQMNGVAGTISEGGKEYVDGVVSSLSYLRDRIGVPRDMKLPAARLVRAQLNWSIAKLLDAA